MREIEPCPRCNSYYVAPVNPTNHGGVPMIPCVGWGLLAVMIGAVTGPIGIALGLFTAAALFVTGIVATAITVLRRWYRCSACQLEWCDSPWDTAHP